MRAVSYRQHAYGSHTSLRRRLAAGGLALGLGALLLIGLITLGVLPERRRESDVLATFDVRPQAPIETRGARQAPRARATRRPESPPPVTVPPPPPTPFPAMIILTRQEFAAADIGRIKPSRNTASSAADTAGTADSGSGNTVGTGPDGQPLYAAQWYREPTRAEMATYIPKRSLGGNEWGMIICRTVERYRVEDCRELGESPGSGLAGAMRQAAWQFLVRPPRVGGKPLVGAWVQIRYDIIEAGRE
ncbi:hypothetical protein D1610_12925 [Sphingomonas gilva]|uniref:Uncharacterized protein n=1 Tax=Sphingomonas gilva TaxID=2305907 RepID=A0A396RL22_9SPHN|nr:hypothetical protein [Sphingomonas gilva]RHW17024.1 hypothetical protein D1610_12925 [Sphingomonas gilva]